MNFYENLKKLELEVPKAPPSGGIYTPAKEFGDGLVYISGCGPIINEPLAGKLGKDYTTADGKQWAKQAMLNVLAVLENAIGDLNKVEDVVKILVLVNSADDFYEQPAVADGATQLLKDTFGVDRLPSRSAIGVNTLPGNIPVEIEAIFKVK